MGRWAPSGKEVTGGGPPGTKGLWEEPAAGAGKACRYQHRERWQTAERGPQRTPPHAKNWAEVLTQINRDTLMPQSKFSTCTKLTSRSKSLLYTLNILKIGLLEISEIPAFCYKKEKQASMGPVCVHSPTPQVQENTRRARLTRRESGDAVLEHQVTTPPAPRLHVGKLKTKAHLF